MPSAHEHPIKSAQSGKKLTPVESAVEKYLQYLTIERGLAKNTVESYGRDLRKYTQYLQDQGVITPQAITKKNVRDFATLLAQPPHNEQKPLSARSVARVIVAVRGMHKFWLQERVTSNDFAAAVQPPNTGSRLPKAITVAEVTRLLEAPDTSTPTGLRDRAILEFLYSTGARITEVIGVDVDDLSLVKSSDAAQAAGTGVVRLFGKGNKERLVPVGSFATRALNDYIVRARPGFAAHGKGIPALFLNARGGRLSRQGAWLVLKKAAERAKLDVEISPHTLRHSYATHLLEGGADIRVVQELLGHASVTTTQIYTKVTADTLREVFAATHPRAL
ncbi:MAG: site-specific tyrosine recombinase XerD [Rothia sp. (in: high G+C Gram-positive bacteria)]|nr:site-specific tyrosine recombinase XerD [Rothia sp. (in: high G+C Gram-positive bacteria)]